MDPFHVLHPRTASPWTRTGLADSAPTLAASVLRRLSDPHGGATAALAFLAGEASQRGPGWSRLAVPALLQWLLAPSVALRTGQESCKHEAPVAGLCSGVGGASLSGGSGAGEPSRLGLRPRAQGLPPQLWQPLRQLLAALPRCVVLYGSLDEHARRLLTCLVAALPSDGTAAATAAAAARAGGAGGCSNNGRGGSYLGPAHEWVDAALQATRRYGQTGRARSAPAPPASPAMHRPAPGECCDGVHSGGEQHNGRFGDGGFAGEEQSGRPDGARAGLGANAGAGAAHPVPAPAGECRDVHGGVLEPVAGAANAEDAWWWVPELDPDPDSVQPSGLHGRGPDPMPAAASCTVHSGAASEPALPASGDGAPSPSSPRRCTVNSAGVDGGGECAAARGGRRQSGPGAGAEAMVAGLEEAERTLTARAGTRREGTEGEGPHAAGRQRREQAEGETADVGEEEDCEAAAAVSVAIDGRNGDRGGGGGPSPLRGKRPRLAPAAGEEAAAAQPPGLPAAAAVAAAAGQAPAAGDKAAPSGGGAVQTGSTAQALAAELLLLFQELGSADAEQSVQRAELLLERLAAAYGTAGGGPTATTGSAAAAAAAAALPPDAVLRVVRRLLTPRLSGAGARVLLAAAVLPAVAAVERVMPKPLQQALLAASAVHPRPLAEAVLAPVARGSGLTPGQAQLLAKTAGGGGGATAGGGASLPLPLQMLVIRAAASAAPDWGEPHVSVAQGLLDAAGDGANEDALAAVSEAVCGTLRCGPAAMRRSVSLCRLLLSLLSRHGRRLGTGALGALREAAAATSTFLTKPCLAKLSELGS